MHHCAHRGRLAKEINPEAENTYKPNPDDPHECPRCKGRLKRWGKRPDPGLLIQIDWFDCDSCGKRYMR
jgi:hypothetical protein